jgi:hydroxyacylglutathione hydrolase
VKIEIIKCLTDNFSYLLINEKNLDTCVVDPGEANPVLEYIKKNNLNLKYILNTHHHGDHIGGNNILKSKFDAKILAFEDDKDRIPMIDIPLKDNQVWKDGMFEFKVIHVPGHTSGHICFHFFYEKTVFTGDTLFSLGCGRIFEGSYEDMFNSLLRLKVLPPETKVYFGHEYTLNNAIFCQRFDQNNSELNKKILNIKKKLDSGFPSVPSTIKDELNCNIFLRAKNQEEFSKLRDLKDNF